MLDNELVVKLIQLATTADAGEREKLVKELAGGHARDDVWEKFLKFTKKEISRMPQEFRKLFTINGLRAHIRKRVRGKSVNYEVRCRMQGIDVSAGGTSVEEAKDRFIEKLFAESWQISVRNASTSLESAAATMGVSNFHFPPSRTNPILRKLPLSESADSADGRRTENAETSNRGMSKTFWLRRRSVSTTRLSTNSRSTTIILSPPSSSI